MRALFVLGGVVVGGCLVYISIRHLRHTRASAREEMFVRLGSRVLRTLPA